MTSDQFIGYKLLNTTAVTTIVSAKINYGLRPTGKHAHDKSLEDRNAVNSELGLHILNCAVGKILIKKDYEQHSLFENGM